ncbi:hypothetical protein [Marinobacter sp. tcs-11]|jgi:Asp-tRNA(Asn)/Glu-tRNA(Gln) amidotransferase A subunit family amidase|uniref:hypothetical protein n=1 Tax=Marinobacter sp. tcs-11 TaxID=1742860 RepID=UPI00257A4619|nr:hypothetical protein [Marinobacter sp. tcs-11]
MNSLLQAGHDGAFVADGFARRPGSNALVDGPLKGLRLAVKDVFQVEGMRCGAGNPAWLAEQPVAGQRAHRQCNGCWTPGLNGSVKQLPMS